MAVLGVYTVSGIALKVFTDGSAEISYLGSAPKKLSAEAFREFMLAVGEIKQDLRQLELDNDPNA